MATAKENGDTLRNLVVVHLAPRNRAEIDRAPKAFRVLKNASYPVKADALAGHIAAPSTTAPPPSPVAQDDSEPEAPAVPEADVDDIGDVEPGDAEAV